MAGLGTQLKVLALRVAPLAGTDPAEQSTIAAAAVSFIVRLALRVWHRHFGTEASRLENSLYRHPFLLKAAASLLGICIIIISGLKFTGLDARTYSDEVAWLSAIFLVFSIFLSYLSKRADIEQHWQTRIANWSFLLGIDALIVSMVIAAWQL